MNGLHQGLEGLDLGALGEAMHAFVRRAYPIPRSITGDGVRETLRMARELVDLDIREVPSGTEVFDWTVPQEWNLREAHLTGPDGRRVVDVADHSLHLLSYSEPVRRTMTLDELQSHLHSLPGQPELIPYRTSYYRRTWGFCLPHRQREALAPGDYEVVIDTRLEDGSLTYGELFLPGRDEREILISTHVCHPSLANDNLSGIAVALQLARLLGSVDRRLGIRFLFIPGTIGSITWLWCNQEQAGRIAHGLVAANLGDGGAFHYKRSRQGDAPVDRAAALVLADRREGHALMDFVPFGYDERQYCSPGFDLPVGSLTRTPWGQYPEYHTSADDPDFVRPEHLAASLETYLQLLAVLDGNETYRNLNPHCEPQLGKRGLYRSIGGSEDGREKELALLWVLNQSDGTRDLLSIAERSGLPFHRLREAADALLAADLLEEVR